MSKRKDGKPRGQYTTEFKLEAVRLVKGGQSATVTAKVTPVICCCKHGVGCSASGRTPGCIVVPYGGAGG